MSNRMTRRRLLTMGGAAVVAAATLSGTRRPAHRAVAATATVGASPMPDPRATLLLRMEVTGGLMPVEYRLTELPVFSLFADGTVVTTGPMIEIFPQPALPNLRALTLTEEGIGLVLQRAREAGLFAGDKSYPNSRVADAPSTIFTAVTDGRAERVAAAALGIGEETLPAGADREARANLIDLAAFLNDLPGQLPPEAIAEGDRPFEIERIRLFARPIDPANPPWTDSGLVQPTVAWPLPAPLAAFGDPTERPDLDGTMRCGVTTPEETAALLPALQGANRLTPWESEHALYQLWVRPLLPDESGC